VVAVGWLPLYLVRPRAGLGMVASAGVVGVGAAGWVGPGGGGRGGGAGGGGGGAPPGPGVPATRRGCGRAGGRWPVPPGAGARPLGWAALALVGLTAVAVDWVGRRRFAVRGLDEPGAANLLFACGLVVPYLFYYDETVFLLPLLVLWSHWAALGRGQL